jgi:hypothetical protein
VQDETAQEESVPRATVKRTAVRVRRAPRYGRFIGGTIGLFVVVSFFSAYIAAPVGGDYTRSQVFGYLVLVSIALGLPVGSLVALALDRLLARSARTVVAEQTGVHEAEVAPEPGRESSGVRPPQDGRAHDPQSNENE